MEHRNVFYVITDIQDDRMVVVQDLSGKRMLISVGRLHLLDTVLEINKEMSNEEVCSVMGSVDLRKEDVVENDFERFKRDLRATVEEELLKNKGF